MAESKDIRPIINRVIGYALLFGLLSFLLKDKIIWIIVIIATIILIRFLADLYWKGKDKNWWE